MNIDVEALLRFLLYLVPIAYLFAWLFYVLVFWRDTAALRRLARPLLVTAVILNLVYLTLFTAHFAHIPAVTVHQVLGAVGFALAATYLWVESRTRTLHSGPFVLVLVLLCQLDALLHPRLSSEVPPLLDSFMFSFHVSFAILGYSALALAAAYGFIYLLLYNEMRLKRFGLIFQRLPALAVLDQMNFSSAAIGFVFLAIAMITGIVWVLHVRETPFWDPKLGVGLVTLVLYGLTLFGRRYRSWRGPRLAYSSLIGFLVLLLSMYLVNFLFTKYHFFV